MIVCLIQQGQIGHFTSNCCSATTFCLTLTSQRRKSTLRTSQSMADATTHRTQRHIMTRKCIKTTLTPGHQPVSTPILQWVCQYSTRIATSARQHIVFPGSHTGIQRSIWLGLTRAEFKTSTLYSTTCQRLASLAIRRCWYLQGKMSLCYIPKMESECWGNDLCIII